MLLFCYKNRGDPKKKDRTVYRHVQVLSNDPPLEIYAGPVPSEFTGPSSRASGQASPSWT